MKKTITTLALAGLLVGAGSAEAATKYKGKTTSGSTITFKRSGGRISKIKTGVSTICLPTTTSARSTAGSDRYTPPGSYRIGKKVKRSKLQKTSFWWREVTKNYTVTTRRRGRKITGRLEMSFSYAVPGWGYYGPTLTTYICSGKAKFSAKPR